VGSGVWEARVMFGPGYRIYFAKDGAQLVLLLLGGDKSTQTADVARAQGFWKGYQEGKRRGKTK
jgi:putative addiction module killer protein